MPRASSTIVGTPKVVSESGVEILSGMLTTIDSHVITVFQSDFHFIEVLQYLILPRLSGGH